MDTRTVLVATIMLAALTATFTATAATPKETALLDGARALTAEEIAERYVGKTVTFRRGDKQFLVYYGADNTVAGELIGGGWSDTGYYGITNANTICLSWASSDEGRLGCYDVLDLDGVVHKFNPDGSLAGNVLIFQDGKTF